MKRKTMIFCVTAIMFTACTGGSNYEKAIADFLQTDRSGTWTDMQFKVIEMGKAIDITVGDSIQILTDKFEADKSQRLDILNNAIERNTKSMDKERFPSMKKFYQKLINENQSLVDSLSKTVVTLPENYKNATATKVLAKEISCKFSIVHPIYKARQEMTETFILNADGDKCYHMKSKRKNL